MIKAHKFSAENFAKFHGPARGIPRLTAVKSSKFRGRLATAARL